MTLLAPSVARASTALVMIWGVTLGGCALTDPFHSHVQGCAAGGHTPGSQAFTHCMSGAGIAEPSDEARERRRWMARLQREQIEAEARVRRERSVVGLVRP